MNHIDQLESNMPTRAGFHLDKINGKFMGVCAGIANRFDWDVNLVRIGFALGTVLGVGSLLVVYLVIGLIAD